MQNCISQEIKVIDSCRVCGNSFFKNPLLEFSNMPGGAQYLPDAKSIKYDKGIDLRVCQCRGCGLIQLNNQPVKYYREVIRSSAFSEEMMNFREEQFKNFINNYNLKNKKIIEVGCGYGEYLSIVKKLGSKVFGIEQSEESVNHCIAEGLNVTKGYIENSTYVIDNGPFDCFLLLSFLEHIPNINTFLRGVYNNLSEDSIGLVEVPNFDMILKKNLFSEFIIDHLFYFTENTLKTTLKLSGFDVDTCDVIWHDYIISAVVKKRKKLEINDFKDFEETMKNEIAKYVHRFEDKKVAIWGAGHQALTIISLTNLSKKICYVIDSAVFKQNKFTPATHIPIVSPDKLQYDSIDAIIIMAASYSDEIAKDLIKRCNNDLNISILRDNKLEIIKE